MLGALHRRSKCANFCCDLMQKQFVVPTYAQKFYCSQCFLSIQLFKLFAKVKVNANYAEICRVGYLDADFQYVLLFNFLFFHNISNSANRSKKKKS